jgi:hypothetical protein
VAGHSLINYSWTKGKHTYKEKEDDVRNENKEVFDSHGRDKARYNIKNRLIFIIGHLLSFSTELPVLHTYYHL